MGVCKFAKLMLSPSVAETDPHWLRETSLALPKFIPLHVILKKQLNKLKKQKFLWNNVWGCISRKALWLSLAIVAVTCPRLLDDRVC